MHSNMVIFVGPEIATGKKIFPMVANIAKKFPKKSFPRKSHENKRTTTLKILNDKETIFVFLNFEKAS